MYQKQIYFQNQVIRHNKQFATSFFLARLLIKQFTKFRENQLGKSIQEEVTLTMLVLEVVIRSMKVWMHANLSGYIEYFFRDI